MSKNGDNVDKYNDFLKEKITSTKYGITASFLEEEGVVYIVDGTHKIPFKFAYKDEWYNALLITAVQLLNVTVMIEQSKKGVYYKLAEEYTNEEHDDLE